MEQGQKSAHKQYKFQGISDMSIYTQRNPEEEAIPIAETSRSVKAKARILTLKADLMAEDGLS